MHFSFVCVCVCVCGGGGVEGGGVKFQKSLCQVGGGGAGSEIFILVGRVVN